MNTDFTDYTDSFYGDVDIPWSSVVRRVLNTDFTDCTDYFLRTRKTLLMRGA